MHQIPDNTFLGEFNNSFPPKRTDTRTGTRTREGFRFSSDDDRARRSMASIRPERIANVAGHVW